MFTNLTTMPATTFPPSVAQVIPLARSNSFILAELFAIDQAEARKQLNLFQGDLHEAGKAIREKYYSLKKNAKEEPKHWLRKKENKNRKSKKKNKNNKNYENIRNNVDSWEYCQNKLWIKYPLDKQMQLETSFIEKKDCTILETTGTNSTTGTAEAACCYVDLKQMTSSNSSGVIQRIRRSTNLPKLYLDINNYNSLRQSFSCSQVPNIHELTFDKSTKTIITACGQPSKNGVFQSVVVRWGLRMDGTFNRQQETKVGDYQRIIYMDAKNGWTLYAVQYHNVLKVYLQDQHDQNNLKSSNTPYLITELQQNLFGGICKLIINSNPSLPPSIIVSLVGGFRVLQYSEPQCWNNNKNGEPSKSAQNWTVTPRALTPNEPLNTIHVIDDIILVTACNSTINFFSLCPGTTYGQHITANTFHLSNIVQIESYQRVMTEYGLRTQGFESECQKVTVYYIVVATADGHIQTFQVNTQYGPINIETCNRYHVTHLPRIRSFTICGNPPKDVAPVISIDTVEGQTFMELTKDTGNNHVVKESLSPQLSWLEKKALTDDTIALVQKNSDEYNSVTSEYDAVYLRQQQVGKSHSHIKNIWRVQNLKQWKRYKSFIKNHTGNNCRNDKNFPSLEIGEKRLFHGTSCDVVDAVLNQGFDSRLAGKNGSVYGSGINFARDSSFSLSYVNKGRSSSSNPFGGNANCMFLARVFVGNMAIGKNNAKRPPPLDPNFPDGELFDSTVDSLSGGGPNIHVIYDNHQVYPEYLLELENSAVSSGSFSVSFGIGNAHGGSNNFNNNFNPSVNSGNSAFSFGGQFRSNSGGGSQMFGPGNTYGNTFGNTFGMFGGGSGGYNMFGNNKSITTSQFGNDNDYFCTTIATFPSTNNQVNCDIKYTIYVSDENNTGTTKNKKSGKTKKMTSSRNGGGFLIHYAGKNMIHSQRIENLSQ
jgi:hypothetical protein